MSLSICDLSPELKLIVGYMYIDLSVYFHETPLCVWLPRDPILKYMYVKCYSDGRKICPPISILKWPL